MKRHRPASIQAGPGWYVLSVLSLLMGFASISTDLYLPAMPMMAQSLHADTGLVEWTVSGYLIGFSLGQLLWGPIGDRWGRRPSVGIGLVLFVIGSAGCGLSTNVHMMIGWRMVQALGACASVALSRAMVRDLYEGSQAAKMLSTLITVMAVAPLVGGQITTFAGWRAIFWVLVGIGLFTLLALFTIPETLATEKRNREPLTRVMGRYAGLLCRRRLLGYAGAGGFLYAGMFAYIAGTPFAYINYYHVPAQLYGLLFGLGVIGIMATNMVNSTLVMRFGHDRMLFSGTLIAAISAIAVGIFGRTDWGGLWGLVIPLFVFASSTGLIVANSIAGALADFPESAGTVSALIGAIHYGSGIAGSGLVGAFADGTPWPMAWVILACGILSLFSMGLLISSPLSTHCAPCYAKSISKG